MERVKGTFNGITRQKEGEMYSLVLLISVLNTNDEEMDDEDGPMNLPFGQLYFGFPVIPPKSTEPEDPATHTIFKGEGQTLRRKKK